MAKQKVVVEVCDNPRCDSEPQISTKEDPALGFYLGKGFWADGAGGGPLPATYACSKECIVPAINANIDRSPGRDPLTGNYS